MPFSRRIWIKTSNIAVVEASLSDKIHGQRFTHKLSLFPALYLAQFTLSFSY